MTRENLRVYFGPEEEITSVSGATTGKKVTVPLTDVLTPLTDAVRYDRSWLQDFESDEITISSDLYEVILAYQHFHRPSA